MIWRFSDGKAGHDAQSRGLSQALGEQTGVSEFSLDVSAHRAGIGAWLRHRYQPGASLPRPDLLIGAGHGSHWPMLAARRRWGGRIVTLMKPSLPLSWFDLCVIPEHDTPPLRDNVLLSKGVLNSVKLSPQRDPAEGLILLGGPSRHYRWNDGEMLTQIQTLLETRSSLHWNLIGSPRTPVSLVDRLQKLAGVNCSFYQRFVEHAWQHKLARAGHVWVSEDSVSMVYEALTSGASVGLLGVPRAGSSRVSRGVDQLIDSGWVAPPAAAHAAPGPGSLNEAARCARWIKDRWLDS